MMHVFPVCCKQAQSLTLTECNRKTKSDRHLPLTDCETTVSWLFSVDPTLVEDPLKLFLLTFNISKKWKLATGVYLQSGKETAIP